MKFVGLLQPLLGDFIEQLGKRKSECADEEELDNWEFLEFEAKFQLTSTLGSALNGPVDGSQVQSGVRDEFQYFDERIHQALGEYTSEGLESPLYDDVREDDKHLLAHQYAIRGIDHDFDNARLEGVLLPDSKQHLRQTVERFTRINQRFERQSIDRSADASREGFAEVESLPWINGTGAYAERLYQLLAEESSTSAEHKHEVLIQLPGLNNTPIRQKTVFEMLLSTCPTDQGGSTSLDWQDTLCTVEMDFEHHETVDSSLCRHILKSKNHRVLLHLSISDSRLRAQTTQQQCRHASSFLGLHEILDLGLLKDEDLDNRVKSLDNKIKRFRLALQLGVALHQLYMGPWLQDNWSADVVRFLYREDTCRIDRLDQPFIPCQLNQNWTKNSTFPDEACRQVDTCPQFFLHFAQLLLDIARGERGMNFDTKLAMSDWYAALDQQVTLSFQDEPLRSYGEAIRGCLHYSLLYSVTNTKLRDPKLRAQEIINEHIVRHLRKNLRLWEDVREDDSHALTFTKSNESRMTLPSETCKTHDHESLLQRHATNPRVQTRASFDAEFVLFADDDASAEPRDKNAPQNDFIKRMTRYIHQYIICLPETIGNVIRIAILDTGLHMDDDDDLLAGGSQRIIQQKNFVDPTAADCNDTHGHGTHVARLLLRFAPRAHIVIGKVSEGRSLKQTGGLEKITAALRWAGDNADIINLSFGLGNFRRSSIQSAIKELANKGKLIFAAASNAGGNGVRAYPASEHGVFCIHATNASGDKAPGMNPPPQMGSHNNFSTLGVKVDSVWAQEDVYISGTSFATPIAATMAANALEYARCSFPNEYNETRQRFLRYGFIEALFLDMAKNSRIDGYDYMKPWTADLWTDSVEAFDHQVLCQKLREFATGAHPRGQLDKR